VVELGVERLERGLDVGEVQDPPGGGADRAGDVEPDAEAVAVETAALVVRRDVREAVGGFEGEFFEDVHGSYFLKKHLKYLPQQSHAEQAT